MNQEVIFNSKRVPETHYFKYGYVKFKKVEGVLRYQIWQYTSDGMMSQVTHVGVVDSEQKLKDLLALQDLGSVMT